MKLNIPILEKLKKKDMSVVAKATMWFLICSVIQKSMSMITIPIFTRIMTKEQMGQFTAYTTWLQVFTIITTFRLDYGVFNKGMSLFSDDREGYTSSMLGTTSVLTIITFILYLFFRKPINAATELSTFITCVIFLELLVAPAINFWSLYQRYAYRYKSVIAVTLSLSLCHTLIALAAVLLSEEKGTARILTNACVQIVFGTAIYIVCLAKSRNMFCMKYISYAIKFNIPLMPHYFSTYILEQSDKIMIQKMVGQAEMGIYGVACSIAQVIKIVTSSITNALVPWQYEALEKKRYKDVGKRIVSVVLAVELIIVLFISLAPEVMKIMASADYQQAVYIIPPISSSVFIVLYFGLVVNIEFFYEKNKFVMYVSCFSAVLNLLINYIGIKTWGYLAAAYATFICYVISGFCHMLYSNHLVKKNSGGNILNPWHYILIAGTATAAIVVMSLLYDYIWIRYAVILLLGVLLFLNRKKILQLVQLGKD